MMFALRRVLSLLLLCHVVMSAVAAQSAGVSFGSGQPTYGAPVAVFVVAPLMWLLYAAVPLDRVAPRLFLDPEEDPEALTGDTGGLHHDDVIKLKGYEMVPYICPRITEAVYRSTKIAKTSMVAATRVRKMMASGRVDVAGAAASLGKAGVGALQRATTRALPNRRQSPAGASS